MEKLEIKQICFRCGEVNTVSIDNVSIKMVNCFDETGEKYRLMYYECERCKNICVVQIDNKETLEIFENVRDLMFAVIKMRNAGKMPSRRMKRKRDKLDGLLNKKREELKELCNGKKMYDEDGNIFTELLTNKEGGDIIESDM